MMKVESRQGSRESIKISQVEKIRKEKLTYFKL